MIIGVPREVKDHEFRVAITPAGVRELRLADHRVLVEAGAGAGSSIPDGAYERAGATVVDDPAAAWEADLVLKVKEPVPDEYPFLREDLILFTYLHLAANRGLTETLVDAGCVALGYETVTDGKGGLPLLAPMSEVAGRMAPQVGAASLERERGGRGVLLGGVSGVAPAHVVVVGAGTAGHNAARLAAGMEAQVTLLDIDITKLRHVDALQRGRIATLRSNRLTLEGLVEDCELLIGAVLVPGARAPLVVTEEMVAAMPSGAVIVDVSIDQGGCVATSRMTTHSDPTFVSHGVVHYCVGNMPGAVPHTSTYALTNATTRYAERLAEGPWRALAEDPGLASGVNVADGAITNEEVAEAHGLEAVPVGAVLDLS